jgi:BirA family biotin operon repressor/biotin-[acetyl-CoA-carboxylase] ligase
MVVPVARGVARSERLDAARIRAELAASRAGRLERLEVLDEVDSTNTRLLAGPPPPCGRAEVCIAELQSSGRGRQGRPWVALRGSGITLSIGWCFERMQRAPALSLAVGVAALRALERVGAAGVMLKWPNDLWLAERKLGGVLVELQTQESGTLHAVIGVGLNVTLSAPMRRALEEVGARAGAVADACRGEPPRRDALAGVLLDELIAMLVEFEREGFQAFHAAWSQHDALKDRPASVGEGERTLVGRARGVDLEGALLLDTGDRVHRVVSGEVSLRPAGWSA